MYNTEAMKSDLVRTMDSPAQITAHYQALLGADGEPPSLRAFAAAINHGLPMPIVSYQTLLNWKSGDKLPNPRTIAMMLLLVPETDWRYEFALALHQALGLPANG